MNLLHSFKRLVDILPPITSLYAHLLKCEKLDLN